MTEPVLMDRSEAATRLHVSVRTVRRYAAAGRVEEVRISPHVVLVTQESVEALVQEGRRKDAAEPTA